MFARMLESARNFLYHGIAHLDHSGSRLDGSCERSQMKLTIILVLIAVLFGLAEGQARAHEEDQAAGGWDRDGVARPFAQLRSRARRRQRRALEKDVHVGLGHGFRRAGSR